MSRSLSAGARVGRWTLEEALGAGSFGSAWRVADDHGRVAALKLLGGPPGGEVEALARVCHPAVPAVLDAAGEPTPFVVMSLARGRTLTRMICAGRATEQPAIAIAGVLADALSVLHHAGVAHGDIKPDNVIVGSVRRGEIMLVDFGMAGADEGGTLQYAAPERLQGAPPSSAADVYALGLLVWEMLRGTLPFAELGVSASLVRRRSEAPLLDGQSPWLTDLVGRMLAPDPAHRPDADVVTDILAAHGATLPRITPELVRSRARTVHVPVPAVDTPMRQWLDDGGVLQVVGRRQYGRAHTLSRAVTVLQARGQTWLRMASTSQVWGAITEALRDPALPGAPSPLPEHPHKLDRAEAAAAALEDRAACGLHLLVDDLDTLDSGSLATVQALVRRGGVSVCVATSEPVDWIEDRAALAALDRRGVESLVVGVLGLRDPLPALVDRVVAISGGVPGLAVEFLASACREGALVRRAQRWLVDEIALEALALRQDPEDVVAFEPGTLAARLGGLLAAAGAGLPVSQLAALLDASPAAVEEALERLLDCGYALVEHDHARCASQAASQALARGCHETPAFHRMLAVSLMASADPPAGRLAWHIVGGEDAGAAAEHGPSLLRAVTLLDSAQGGRLADALWALAPTPSLAAPRVDALRLAGRAEEAVAFGEERRAAGFTGVELLTALARAHLSRGEGTDGALAVAREARAQLGDDPLPLALVLIEAKALFRADDVEGAIAACADVRPPDTDADQELLDDWLALLVVHAQSLHRRGSATDAIAVLETVPRDLGYGRPARALLDGSLGRLLYHAGRYIDAAEVMARAAGADAGLGVLDRARMLNNAGLVYYQSGRRLKALAHWEDALLLFERLGALQDQVRVSVNLCVGYREAGRWERARQAGTWAFEQSGKRELFDMQAMAAGNLGDLFADQRVYTDAERWYLRAGRIARENGLTDELVELARRNAELAVMRDDADALVRSDEALRLAEQQGAPIEAARSRVLRAVCLARRSGDRAAIEELLEAAETACREAGASGELATVRLWSAEAWIALGEPERATVTCDKVVVFAEEMGHVGLRTRADQLLAEARKAQAASAQDQRLDLLVNLAVAVARCQDDEAGLLSTIADAALELLCGDRSFVVLVDDPEAGSAHQRPETHVVARSFADGVEPGEPSSSVVRRVLEARSEVIAADLSERGDLREARSVMALSLRSAMCVPMIEGEQLLGVIYVDSGSVSEDELSRSARFMRALAAHAAVAVANARRIQAIRNRAAWAAEVAHDMRSPVSSILTIAETVMEEPHDVELVVECMEDVLLASRRSLEMAERFLSNGRSTREELSVDTLIGDLGRTLAPQARVRGVALEWSGGAGMVVLGDRVELGRVLLNLVSNAIKYSDRGGCVTLEATRAGDAVRVTVRDRGPGVPDAALETIFDRGVQAPGARQGHGIGLSVVQRLVEAHGGRISVANHPDGGAIFTTTFPLVRSARQAG